MCHAVTQHKRARPVTAYLFCFYTLFEKEIFYFSEQKESASVFVVVFVRQERAPRLIVAPFMCFCIFFLKRIKWHAYRYRSANRTRFHFDYFPKFWLPLGERPSLEQTLLQTIRR